MTNEELKQALVIIHPSLVFEEGYEWLNMYVESPEWLSLAQKLRRDEQLFFD